MCSSDLGAVYPTPTIGMVGLLDDVDHKMTLDFKEEGDVIFLMGTSRSDINSSEYLHKICAVEYSPAPYFDLEEEYSLQKTLAALIGKGLIRSAHDVSEGGLLTALLESGFHRGLGFQVRSGAPAVRRDAYWLGESQSRVVVTVSASSRKDFLAALGGFPCEELGSVTSGKVEVEGSDWGIIAAWKERYDGAIGGLLEIGRAHV